MKRRAVFMDRDGTINIDKGYVYRPEDWEWIPGAIEAIAALKKHGFLIIIITNQAGIARGYYNEDDMVDLHNLIDDQLKQHNVAIDKVYHCPHHPEFGKIRKCECRKPMPGMILRAKEELDIDLAHSWLVGDKASDIRAGLAAGVKSILVLTGYGPAAREMLPSDNVCVKDIGEASRYIISHT